MLVGQQRGQPLPCIELDLLHTVRAAGVQLTGRGNTDSRLDHLIGQRVKDPQGKEVGDVENVLVRPDGKVAGLVVEWGGLAGVGASQRAVPWKDVQVSPDGKQVTVNATREQLEKQPKYDPDVPANAGVDPDIKPLRR